MAKVAKKSRGKPSKKRSPPKKKMKSGKKYQQRVRGTLGGKGLKTKRVRPTKKRLTRKEGVHMVVERGEVLTLGSTSQVQFVGHHTTPEAILLRGMWMAAFNKLMGKAAAVPVNETNTQYNFLANTFITITYRKSLQDAVAPYNPAARSFESYQPGLGSYSPEQFADWALSDARPWNNTNEIVDFSRMTIQDTTFNPDIRLNTEILLSEMSVTYFAKSALKMQNRSKTGTSTEADVIDDVPLYGKTYFGNGRGPILMNDVNQTKFVADNYFGVIKQAGYSGGVEEPVDPSDFRYVKRSGKIAIAAGQIKTSVIKDQRTISWNRLYELAGTRKSNFGRQDVISNQSSLKYYSNRALGKFEVCGLEKVMNVDNTIPIVIAYECQHDLVIKLKQKRKQIAGIYFKSNVGTLAVT